MGGENLHGAKCSSPILKAPSPTFGSVYRRDLPSSHLPSPPLKHQAKSAKIALAVNGGKEGRKFLKVAQM